MNSLFCYIISLKNENVIEKGSNYFMKILEIYDQDGINLRLQMYLISDIACTFFVSFCFGYYFCTDVSNRVESIYVVVVVVFNRDCSSTETHLNVLIMFPFVLYTAGIPQRSDTDVHSVVTAKTSAAL